jgi:hypothetical protein
MLRKLLQLARHDDILHSVGENRFPVRPAARHRVSGVISTSGPADTSTSHSSYLPGSHSPGELSVSFAQIECLMRHRDGVIRMSRPPVIPVYP